MNGYRPRSFYAHWNMWENDFEYEIFDAVDDWLINGTNANTSCFHATRRMIEHDYFFVLSDCLLTGAENGDTCTPTQ